MLNGTSSLSILFVLSHSLHVRNFLASGLLDQLARRGHRLTALIPAALREVVEAEARRSGCLGAVEALEPYLRGRLLDRIRGVFRTGSYVQRSHLSTYRHKLRLRTRSPRAALELRVLAGLGRVSDLERLARAVERWIPVKRKVRELLERVNPHLVVSATFIHDAVDVELLKAARLAGVPTVAFPASWDTLTSKGFFLVAPDYLMVWGEESFRHAVEYHGFAPERVFVTGPPHFDIYAPTAPSESREEFLSRRGIPPGTRAILFAGTTVTYWADEPNQLRALSKMVQGGELGDCVLWYRPHPRRRDRDGNALDLRKLEELKGLPGVYVDDQILRHKAQTRPAYSVEREDLAHYRRLLDACDGVVTAFSTMIIEAALLGKPSLVVAFGLGDNTPEQLYQHSEYEHMRDVISTPGVTLCRSLDEVRRGIRGILSGEFAPFEEALRKRAGEIAHCLDGRARERMVDAIERAGNGRR